MSWSAADFLVMDDSVSRTLERRLGHTTTSCDDPAKPHVMTMTFHPWDVSREAYQERMAACDLAEATP